MGKPIAGATRAAWLVAAQSAVIVFGLVAVPPLTGGRQPLGSAGVLLVAFFATLPWVFFLIAGDYRRQQDEVRELRRRVEELEGRATGGRAASG